MADRDWHGLAGKVRPMLAGAGELPGDEDGWAYEMKWDGLRAIAGIGGGVVSLFSRTGKDIASKYPELQGLAAVAGESGFVLDGEIVAFGADSWPSFEALQQRMNIPSVADARRLAAQIPVTYLVFDLLYNGAGSQLDQPYQARRAQLDALAMNGPNWQTPPAFLDVPAGQVQALSLRHGLEGVMAKRLRSRYEPGRRSPSWRKIKNVHRQEVVVGGWKPGEGTRTGLFGSLLVGVQSPAGLAYAGHVGTGFNQQTLKLLHERLAPLRADVSPFATEVPAEHARVAVWVRPTVVIEVTFVEWTSTGRLRAASYQGLRTDKDAAEVIREPG